MMEQVFTNISCTISGQSVTVIKVMAPLGIRSGLKDLIAVCEDGRVYPLDDFGDGNGIPLRDYRWQIEEWFYSLCKELAYKRANPCYKVYHYTDIGQEYWYEKTDFRKHFTACEG